MQTPIRSLAAPTNRVAAFTGDLELWAARGCKKMGETNPSASADQNWRNELNPRHQARGAHTILEKRTEPS
jgi:hypothetical protein